MVTIAVEEEEEPKQTTRGGEPSQVALEWDPTLSHPAAAGLVPGSSAGVVPPRKYEAASCHPACVVQPTKDAKAASAAKQKGNTLFGERRFAEAADAYAEALELSPQGADYDGPRAVFYGNLAACYLELGRPDDAVGACTRSIALDARYLKAWMRRAKAYEAVEKLDDALADVEEALKIDPTLVTLQTEKVRLEKAVKERNEKLKDEMLGKLKEVGNTFLGYFGMSVDNFQMVQDPATGSYSINYKS